MALAELHPELRKQVTGATLRHLRTAPTRRWSQRRLAEEVRQVIDELGYESERTWKEEGIASIERGKARLPIEYLGVFARALALSNDPAEARELEELLHHGIPGLTDVASVGPLEDPDGPEAAAGAGRGQHREDREGRGSLGDGDIPG